MSNPLSRPVQMALPAAAGAASSSAFIVPAPILPHPSPAAAASAGSSRPSASGPVCRDVPRTSVPAVVEANPSVLFVPPDAASGALGSVVSQRPVAEFLFHLMKMLTDPSIGHLIEWTPQGTIRVHDPFTLEAEVLGKYFRHSKYSSFQRQLNYFGFRKVGSKGRMSPCSFINDTTTPSLTSILSIKRRTATKANKGNTEAKKRKDQPCEPEGQEPSEKKSKLDFFYCVPIISTPFTVTADDYGPPGTLNLPPPVSPISSASASCSDAETQASFLPSISLPQLLPATVDIAARLSGASPSDACENLEATGEKRDTGGEDLNDSATLDLLDNYLLKSNDATQPNVSGNTNTATAAASSSDLASLALELGLPMPNGQKDQAQAVTTSAVLPLLPLDSHPTTSPALPRRTNMDGTACASSSPSQQAPPSSAVTPKLQGLLHSRSSQDFMRDFFDAFQSPFLTPSVLHPSLGSSSLVDQVKLPSLNH